MTATPSAPSNYPQGAPTGSPVPYPPAPAPVQGKKLSATWTGALIAIGAIVAAVGTFLPFEKIVFFANGSFSGSSQFNGLGAETREGPQIANFTPGNAGKIILVGAIIALVLGILVLARKGRLWVSIVALVASAAAVVMGLASLAAPASDQKDLRAAVVEGVDVNGLVKMGATLATVGAGIALLGALLALIVRKRAT